MRKLRFREVQSLSKVPQEPGLKLRSLWNRNWHPQLPAMLSLKGVEELFIPWSLGTAAKGLRVDTRMPFLPEIEAPWRPLPSIYRGPCSGLRDKQTVGEAGVEVGTC